MLGSVKDESHPEGGEGDAADGVKDAGAVSVESGL